MHKKIDIKKLALIHIIKKELNLSDTEYRDILQEATGTRSAKDLDDAQFRKLMYYFVRSSHYRLNPFGLTMRQKLFINYLSQQIGWTDEHLNNFIHKYYHKISVDRLTRQEAIKLIESLKNIAKHQEQQKINN